MCTGVSCVKAVRAKESDCKEVLSFVYRVEPMKAWINMSCLTHSQLYKMER